MKWCTSLALAVAPLVAARNLAPSVEVEFEERGWEHGVSSHGITATSITEIIIIWVNPGGGAATTTMNEKSTVTPAATAGALDAPPPPAAATHTVKVGGPGGLVFQPDQLNNVPVGDTVIFEFLSQNHTVTQSGFDAPCKKLEGGMDSGFQANPNNTVSPAPQVAIQVMASTPLWFYCRQKGHCGKGMVFSINPTAAKTQAQFQQLAIAQDGTGEGTPLTGGAGGSAPPPPAESSAYAPPPPAETSAYSPPPPAAGGATPGQGTVGPDGSCTCFAACSPGSFPSDSQGIGAHGGFGGSLPISMGSMGY